jgi:hypothetical protein
MSRFLLLTIGVAAFLFRANAHASDVIIYTFEEPRGDGGKGIFEFSIPETQLAGFSAVPYSNSSGILPFVDAAKAVEQRIKKDHPDVAEFLVWNSSLYYFTISEGASEQERRGIRLYFFRTESRDRTPFKDGMRQIYPNYYVVLPDGNVITYSSMRIEKPGKKD